MSGGLLRFLPASLGFVACAPMPHPITPAQGVGLDAVVDRGAPLQAEPASSPELALPAVVRQDVVIDNPERAALQARCPDVLGTTTVALGDAEELRLQLPLGRWELMVMLGEQAWSLPLPLSAAARRPDVVRVRVELPPAAAPGFVWIPPGPALIGDVLGVGQEDERPARVVDVPGFWLAVHETTNAEFAAFLDGVGTVSPDWLDATSRKCHVRRGGDGRYTTDQPDLPVVTVSYEGAVAYCAWRTKQTGRRHRLPTEVEWEKAGRGPASWTYSYGDVYRQSAANQESGQLRPVAAFAPSGFGLHDLTGNAFEWVADAYVRDAYVGDAVAPQGEYRVLRGGSFVLDGMFLRNSMRMKLRPGVRADDVGFRVAVDPR